MNGWDPHTLTQCVDSTFLGYLTGVLAVGMLIWYALIALRWNEARMGASESGKAVWGWLIALFLVCSIAGYVALTLALWFPKFSVGLRITALTAQNVICPFFWILARKHKFHLVGVREYVGEKMISRNFEGMTSTEVAAFAMETVTAALAKTNERLLR